MSSDLIRPTRSYPMARQKHESMKTPKNKRKPATVAAADAKCNSDQRLVRRLAVGIVKEAINKGYVDMWDESWNPKSHVEVTLTIAEIRCAAAAINFHPTKVQLRKLEEANEWGKYIAELDGVE